MAYRKPKHPRMKTMMISNNNKKSGLPQAMGSSYIAAALQLVVLSVIERITASMMWINDTKVRAQMQTEVATESGVDESFAVHAYHCLFFNPRTSAAPAPELSTGAFRAAAKAALMARVKVDAGVLDTDDEEGGGGDAEECEEEAAAEGDEEESSGRRADSAGEEEMPVLDEKDGA